MNLAFEYCSKLLALQKYGPSTLSTIFQLRRSAKYLPYIKCHKCTLTHYVNTYKGQTHQFNHSEIKAPKSFIRSIPAWCGQFQSPRRLDGHRWWSGPSPGENIIIKIFFVNDTLTERPRKLSLVNLFSLIKLYLWFRLREFSGYREWFLLNSPTLALVEKVAEDKYLGIQSFCQLAV